MAQIYSNICLNIQNYYKLQHYCRYDQNGNEEKEPIFPWTIILKPTGLVKFREGDSPIVEFLNQFKDNISNGSPIYDFVTYENPDDDEGTVLAQTVVVDGCYPSRYGDEKMFFQHHSFEEDLKLRPEWYCDYMDNCGYGGTPSLCEGS